MPCKCRIHWQGETLDPTRTPAKTLPDFLRDALAFCRAWDSGQPSFPIQTSGSTGAPKTIRLTRSQMQASAQMTAKALGLTAGDKTLMCLNPQYIAGRMMLVRGMEIGLELFLTEARRNPLRSFSQPPNFDFAALVPLQLEAILEDDDTRFFEGGKAIIVGGAPVSPALESRLEAFDCPLWATYGMTETVTHIALRRLNGREKSPYFTALPGVTLSLDKRQCLCITAPSTDGATITTNDRVRLHTATEFEWLGRTDFVINSGGVKVQSEAVERAAEQELSALGLSARLCVLGLPDEQLGQRVVLVLEGAELPPETQKRLHKALGHRLPTYHAPKEIRSHSVFPETATQKIDRKKLRKQILYKEK